MRGSPTAARKRAAEALDLRIPTVGYPPDASGKQRRRRDTPAEIAPRSRIDSNRARLTDGHLDQVTIEVSRVYRRLWDETAADPCINRAWEDRAQGTTSSLDVEPLPFR